jgi:DNA repair exonuclease SbcCD ATPase subunit
VRLASISVVNFRGFARRQTIDLNADIIVVWGANGTGKTSLLDAFQWLILGDLPRLRATALRASEDVITSRYADGPPSVELVLAENDDRTTVTRTGLGPEERLTVRTPDGAQHSDDEAQQLLLQLIGRREANDDAGTWFLRTHLLQQAEMTELLSGDTRERYRFLARFTGLDELGQLDDLLRSELKQLRSVLRERRSELDELRDRVVAARREHEESLEILESQEQEQSSELDNATATLAGLIGTKNVPDAVELVSDAERRRVEIEFVLREIRAIVIPEESALPDEEALQELRNQLTTLISEDQTREAGLLQISGQVTEKQQSVLAAEREQDRQQKLAELALESLDAQELCPVCGQVHDVEKTRARLHQMLGSVDRLVELRQEISGLEQRRVELQQVRDEHAVAIAALSDRIERLDKSVSAAREHEGLGRSLEDRLRTLFADAGSGDLVAQAEQHADRIKEAVEAVQAMLRDATNRAALRRRADSAQRDLEAREARLATLEKDVEALGNRAERAEAVCTWVGKETVAATGRVIAASNPLADELYQRLDVHPTFRRFSLKLDRFREAGHLRPWVHDDEEEKDSSAAQLLSAAQFNSLAVCLFLALNLEQQRALATVMLDDPVQSMDDINILSLVDVLRTVRQQRQVLLTTHDLVLAQLLLRKLRPLKEDERVLLVKLGRWTREGPTVEIEDHVGTSRSPFELVGEPE